MAASYSTHSGGAAFFTTNIKEAAKNDAFRSTPYTLPGRFQITYMSLLPKEDIGSEVHLNTLQTVQVVKGRVRADLNNSSSTHDKGGFIVVPPGVRHNITNLSPRADAKLFVTYYPPEHAPYTFQQAKPEA